MRPKLIEQQIREVITRDITGHEIVAAIRSLSDGDSKLEDMAFTINRVLCNEGITFHERGSSMPMSAAFPLASALSNFIGHLINAKVAEAMEKHYASLAASEHPTDVCF